jgi:tetratricopeptide (TPR) repeat protein
MNQAAASSYPTTDGADWYFWCKRNGRGDVKSAEKAAAQYFSLPQPHPTADTCVVRGLYDVLKGDIQAGRDNFRQALNFKRTFTNTAVVAQLSRDLKDEQARKEVIAAMEEEVAHPADGKKRNASVDKAGMLLLDLLKNGNPSPERLAKIDEAFLKIDDEHRSSAVAWCYLIGTELESLGNKKEAEKYWRRALVDAGKQQVLATLAGDKLVKLHGKSRPDKDELTAADLWPPLKTK